MVEQMAFNYLVVGSNPAYGGTNILNKYFFMWKKRGLFQILSNHLIDYPSPINVSYFWSIGSLVGLCLVIQIITQEYVKE